MHIICYHGLGDALRYAFPLAASLAEKGLDAFLHTRRCLLPCIGRQQALKQIVSIDDGKLAQIGNMDLAAQLYLNALGEMDMAVVLGSSHFDQALETQISMRGIPFWGRSGVGNGAEKVLDVDQCKSWRSTPEYYNTISKLCAIFGAEPPKSVRLNPDLASREHRFRNCAKPLIGIHCTSNWPSRNYPSGDRLIELLSDEYAVWNFDKEPCENMAELAWIMKDSLALMSVNTMMLHLANLAGTPCLNLQGPVWLNKEDAPYLVKESRTTPRPLPLNEIDKNAQLMASLSPEFLAYEFKSFIKSKDRSRWQAE